MIKIGVIVAHNSINMIKEVEPLLRDQCELTLIPYRQIKEMKTLYEQHHIFYDGILFGGLLAKKIIEQEVAEFPTPIFCLDITTGDFYKQIFSILNRYRDLDFSRVFIDFLNEDLNAFEVSDILKETEMPYVTKLEFSEQIYEKVFQQHVDLWESGKIDLSLTRISNIVPRLKEAGIPSVFVFPSPASILEQTQQFINELQIYNFQENQLAIGMVTIKDKDDLSDLDFKQILLHKALLEFNKKTNALSIIQKKITGFELITSLADLKSVTNDFTSCSVIHYLNETLPFQVDLGWGVGTTLYQTKKAAQTANQEASANETPCAYVIFDNDEVIGPLGEDHCIRYTNIVDPEVEQLAETLGISSLNIQKIIAAMSKMRTDQLTADDVAYHLGHTLRQANRILNKLEQKGAATTTFRKQEKLRGRPKKVYKIDFQRVNLQHDA